MNNNRNISMAIALCLSAYALTADAAPKAPRIQTGPDAEVSFDGLHRVDNSVMDMAWAIPTLDLTGYNKLMLVRGGFAFSEVGESGVCTVDCSKIVGFHNFLKDGNILNLLKLCP